MYNCIGIIYLVICFVIVWLNESANCLYSQSAGTSLSLSLSLEPFGPSVTAQAENEEQSITCIECWEQLVNGLHQSVWMGADWDCLVFSVCAVFVIRFHAPRSLSSSLSSRPSSSSLSSILLAPEPLEDAIWTATDKQQTAERNKPNKTLETPEDWDDQPLTSNKNEQAKKEQNIFGKQ